MKTLAVFTCLVGLNYAHAQSVISKPEQKVNPKFLYMDCELASIYGNTNDDWIFTIYGLKANLWDNDHDSPGQYLKTTGDSNFDHENADYDDGQYFTYVGPKEDPWKFVIGPTYAMKNYKVNYGQHIYAKLKVPGKMKEQVMTCKFISKKTAAETLKRATE